MFHLLGFLFIILIAVLLIGLTLIGSVLRALFGFGRRRPAASSSGSTRRPYSQDTTSGSNKQTSEQAQASNEEVISGTSGQGHKKIFTKDDGEYVDFEEVKE